jgi:hypothetical protein
MKRFGKLLMLALVCAVGGCASYYHVHDPSTGKDYYTTEVKQDRSGAATLKDGRTGKQVTVQNSEIEKISEEEYDTARFSQPPAAPPQASDANSKPQASGSSGNPF